MSTTNEVVARKPYRSPELTVYGDVRAITAAEAVVSKKNDQAVKGNNKTA